MDLIVKPDGGQLAQFANMLGAVGDRAPDVLRRALNRAGDETKTQVIRVLTSQTGLKRGVIVKAITVKRANYSDLTYRMTTRGGNISLKYFSPKERGGGVFAKPRGKSTFYDNAFITSGVKPHRLASPKLHGHVYENIQGGRWSGRVEKQRSGVYIPEEMVTGQTAATFESVSRAALEKRIRHELARLLG